MFCRKCYSALNPAVDGDRCSKCGKQFDPARPRTYLRRPFPSPGRVVAQVLATTVFGLLAAAVVAVFQMDRASGH